MSSCDNSDVSSDDLMCRLSNNHGTPEHGAASAKTSHSHSLSGRLVSLQRQHMPKQAQPLFLWNDTILFKPRKQPETPETGPKTKTKTKKPDPEPDPEQQDPEFCVACIADWLLAFFGILVAWAAYSCSDQWFDAWAEKSAGAIPVPVHILTFWRTLARVTLLWCFILGSLAYLVWIKYSIDSLRDEDFVPHCTLASHLACHMLSGTSSYLCFWWQHGRHNRPRPLGPRRLADVENGAVLLRLDPYPHIFASPFLAWLDGAYLTYRDWQRWRAAGAVWAGLERDGKLSADAALYRSLAEVSAAGYMEQHGRLAEWAGHVYVEL